MESEFVGPLVPLDSLQAHPLEVALDSESDHHRSKNPTRYTLTSASSG